MMKRIISRFIILIAVLFGVTLLTFFYTSLSPVDAAQALAVRRYTRPTEEQVAQVREELGLDKPLISQYTDWLGKAIRGDFGDSYNTGKPIIEELTASMKPTLKMAAMALLFTALLSIPLGVLSAAKKGGFADKTIYLFGIVCISVPNYWIGFMLMIAFAVNIPLFSIMGAEN
ncbi:MAG: ABC transporter permease, partial [Ruminococcus sp.]|nr:ABC transporter permease [Ruminococcus sp.]